tara:strand:- start:458 stop:559 length:102 start_codon:yes stop_codon:yes gene_type:complete
MNETGMQGMWGGNHKSSREAAEKEKILFIQLLL